ncbi:MAG TPA: phosphodiester glycosidase family protein [Anaerolineales bacterium]|nr:phosphodiester glycosidase family protein [Anaerolineales bacterium]
MQVSSRKQKRDLLDWGAIRADIGSLGFVYNNSMKFRPIRIILPVFIALAVCSAGYLLYDRGRPAPVPMKQKLYEGVTYRRLVQVFPRPMIAHVLSIDTRVKGIEFLVTPPDSDGQKPLNARTTSQFLQEFDVQIAVNGSGFSPWWSHSLADYYPHVGDPVAPTGFAASTGKTYWVGDDTDGIEPILYINRRNVLSFNNRPSKIYNAISGDRMLVLKGEPASDLDDQELDPRTAIGISRNGRYLYIVVVDGRQPFYSDGATFTGLAKLLVKQGAYAAMSLDGGGSSTMVIEDKDGGALILNSPIDNYIPGRERPVGNHLGIYAK